MKKNLSIAFCAIVALALFAACSKKPAQTTPTGSTADSGTTKGRATEVASGDVREALIKLRRVHFAFDSDALLPDARNDLSEAAAKLAAHAEIHVYIDGHADLRGTTEYNVAVGDRRGNAVKEYLTRSGIDGERLHVVSFGEEKPLAAATTDTANAQNRRVDFRLMRGDVELVLEEGALVDDKGNPLTSKVPTP